jgi:hypothetical protein
LKPIVGRFVMDDDGIRIEISRVTFADLMARKLVEPLGTNPIQWVLAGPKINVPISIKAPKD